MIASLFYLVIYLMVIGVAIWLLTLPPRTDIASSAGWSSRLVDAAAKASGGAAYSGSDVRFTRCPLLARHVRCTLKSGRRQAQTSPKPMSV